MRFGANHLSGGKFKRFSFLWMLLPAFILYTGIIAYPFFYSLVLSLFKWPGVGPKIFVGLANYVNVLTGFMSREFYRALWHNFYFFGLSWIFNIIPGIFIAIFLAAGLRGTNFFKTLYFVPNTLSIVIVGFLWGLLLNPQWGMVNQLLRLIGLDFLAKPWLGDTKLALPTIIAVTAWRSMGFYILVFLAAILGLNREMLEAGRIDGASETQLIVRIIIPQLMPVVITLSILKFIWSFNVFDIVYAMEGSQAGPAGASDVLGTLFYRIAFGGLGSTQVGMGLGATVVTLIFLMVFPVSILYVALAEKRAAGG